MAFSKSKIIREFTLIFTNLKDFEKTMASPQNKTKGKKRWMIQENAGAMEFGPLTPEQMRQIEIVLKRA
jgi:hypothetical protein